MSESPVSPVTVTITEGVAHVLLNRPEVANAFDLPTAHALSAAIDRCEADDVRVVLVTGAGKRFCAGGDVRSFLAFEDPPAYILQLAGVLGDQMRRLDELAKPIVAGVHGAVAGAGLSFVLTADLVVADPATRFTAAFSGIGLTPDSGVSWLLPRVVGLRRATQLVLESRVLSADEALEWGLVTDIDPQPWVKAAETAARIAAGPAIALGQSRRLLRGAHKVDREAHSLDEARTIAAMVTTPEATELIERFTSR